MTSRPVQSLYLGFWSAVAATALSLIYIAGQVAEWAGLLGSAGGPESSSTALGIVVLLTPSLLLGPAFVVLVVCLHQYALPGKEAWSHAAVAFAAIYAALTGMVYFAQLTFVAPRLAQGTTDEIAVFLFRPFDSFLYAIDILGYSFMSLATLFLSVAFVGAGRARLAGPLRAARWFLAANGLLLPFLVGQMLFHPLIWVAALWAVTFPGATLSLAILFRRMLARKPMSDKR